MTMTDSPERTSKRESQSAQTPEFRFIAKRSDLLEAVGLAVTATKGRTPKPALKCCRLDAEDSALSVSATNLDQYVHRTLNTAQVESKGSVLVNAEDLLLFLNSVDDDVLNMRLVSDQFEVSSFDAVRKIPTLDLNEYPTAPQREAGVLATVSAKALLVAMRTVSYAMNTSSGNSNHRCLFLDFGAKSIAVVASDSHKMAACEIQAPVATLPKGHIKVPHQALPLLEKSFGDCDGELEIAVDNRLFLSSGDTVVATSLVEGDFFPWRSVVRAPGPVSFRATGELIATHVARASQAVVKEIDVHAVVVEVSGTGVRFSGRSAEGGESESRLACRLEGNIRAGFNHAWLKETFAAFGDVECTASMESPSMPLLVTGGPLTAVLTSTTLR